MQTRARKRRLALAAASDALQHDWATMDDGLLSHIVSAGGLSRRVVVKMGTVCGAWRRFVWGGMTSLTVAARMDGLHLAAHDDSGIVPWLAGRLRSAPKLVALRVGCGYDKVAAVMETAACHAPRGLRTLELSFYVGEGLQGPLPSSALQCLSRLRSLSALALGTSGDAPQPHIWRLCALRGLTRLEMPYVPLTAAQLPKMLRPLPGVRRAWLDCPSAASLAAIGSALPSLTDLRVDMRPEGEMGVPLATLSGLPTGLVSLHITGAFLGLGEVLLERLPHLVALGVHDRVLEQAAPASFAPLAGRLKHLAIYLSTVGFFEASDMEDGLGLDDGLDIFSWMPTLRALTALTELSFNSFMSENRYALPCLYCCTLGLPGRVRRLNLYNFSSEDDTSDALALAARRWRPCLARLTLHCCEGATGAALRALAAAAGPELRRVELRCCCEVREEEAREALADAPGRPELEYVVADWWSDG